MGFGQGIGFTSIERIDTAKVRIVVVEPVEIEATETNASVET